MARKVRGLLLAIFAVGALVVPATAVGAATKTCEEEGNPHKNFTTTYTEKSACISQAEVNKTEEKATNKGGNEPGGQQP